MAFAFDVVDTVRREEPDLFDDELTRQIRAMLGEAVDAEARSPRTCSARGSRDCRWPTCARYLEHVADRRLAQLGHGARCTVRRTRSRSWNCRTSRSSPTSSNAGSRPTRSASPAASPSTRSSDMTQSTTSKAARARSTVLGYPRLGADRALKRVTEAYWRGDATAGDLHSTAARIRRETWETLRAAGIDEVPCNDFSLYDHVLDTAVLVGAVPPRHAVPADADDAELRRYFAMARGTDGAPAARDDQVVRHQLPLPGPRDRAGHRLPARPAQAGERARRGARPGARRPAGAARPGHLPPAVQADGRCTGRLRAALPPRRPARRLRRTPPHAARCRRPMAAAGRAGAGAGPAGRRPVRHGPRLRAARLRTRATEGARRHLLRRRRRRPARAP